MCAELSGASSPVDLYFTCGVHPTCCNEYQESEAVVEARLVETIRSGLKAGKLVAIGEAGLDYDRLQFCTKELQAQGFRHQIALADRFNLPMFMHNRNTTGDFLSIVTENRESIRAGGLVHSFTGSIEEMQALVDLGFYIGINGCSLRDETSQALVNAIPDNRIIIETDAPWCGVKASHPGSKFIETKFETKKKEKFEAGLLVKDRNEPCMIIQVFEVLCAMKGILDLEEQNEFAETLYKNANDLFFNNKNDDDGDDPEKSSSSTY